MINRLPAIMAVVLLGPLSPAGAGESVVQFGASSLFEHSVTHDLSLSKTGEIELQSGELYEDDGPASGHSYQKPENRETVTTRTWIKKELVIPHPQARAAWLVVLSEQPFAALINGTPQTLGENLSGRKLHRAFSFDPRMLRAGTNAIILRNSGSVSIARDDEFALGSRTRTHHPKRSAKSTDGGRTWDDAHLGPGGKLEGEYGVRIFLDHYRSQGSLTTDVLDVGNLEGAAVGRPLAQTWPIQVSAAGQPGDAGRILIRARTGDAYPADEGHWSDWQVLGEPGGTIERPRGRYLQVALELFTRDPLQSPRLTGLRVATNPAFGPDWTRRVRVEEEHNEQIVRTAIPFEYEPLDHPRLRKLRQDYKLDEVVRGAKGELELMLRLAQWACNYWDWPNHIGDCYPRWDALEILRPYADGKPTGGFCLQFNLVFLQACESFGIPGRAISISQGREQTQHPGGGHEIVELWSNEWKKWVYVDGALAWYVVDEATGTPLSVWELRRRQVLGLQGKPNPAVRVVEAQRTRNRQWPWSGLWPAPLNWYLELRMIPRSNFLQEQSPLPLNQGTDEWSWTGHYVWTDAAVPAGWLFGNRVGKHGDFEWTLNQAHYLLEPARQPGRFKVHLDTVTPSFDTFLAETDGGPKRSVSSGFTWTLHPGQNQLRVRPRNITGREGISSWISLEYAGAPPGGLNATDP